MNEVGCRSRGSLWPRFEMQLTMRGLGSASSHICRRISVGRQEKVGGVDEVSGINCGQSGEGERMGFCTPWWDGCLCGISRVSSIAS